MNPIEKYYLANRIPWKLMVQFIKVLAVTYQIIGFGSYRANHAAYFRHNEITFSHIFIRDWDSVREVEAYPPATGKLAIYEKDSFYQYFNHVVRKFRRIEEISVNPLSSTDDNFKFCVTEYDKNSTDHVFGYPHQLINGMSNSSCLSVSTEEMSETFDSHAFLNKRNRLVDFPYLISAHLNFSLQCITFTQVGPISAPECFNFTVHIGFDNKDYDGQIPVSLRSDPQRIDCPIGDDDQSTMDDHRPHLPTHKLRVIAYSILNLSVIIFCCISLILCLRSLVRAQLLRCKSERELKVVKGWTLTRSEKLTFLNGWYIVICINDFLIIIGSIIKQLIEVRETYADLWTVCSFFLGFGSLLMWIGSLRYLGFLKTYNVLILTLKGALPNCVRFFICATILYIGFMLCGWLVLGPFHFKFATIQSTNECLFSLINGDDMFATFTSISSEYDLSIVHVFLQLYLFSFILLFTCVVLSLFISIIMDVYEEIKEAYKNGWSKSRLQKFYEMDQDLSSSSASATNAGENESSCQRRPSHLHKSISTLQLLRCTQPSSIVEEESSMRC